MRIRLPDLDNNTIPGERDFLSVLSFFLHPTLTSRPRSLPGAACQGYPHHRYSENFFPPRGFNARGKMQPESARNNERGGNLFPGCCTLENSEPIRKK